jgi:hypothetical protein
MNILNYFAFSCPDGPLSGIYQLQAVPDSQVVFCPIIWAFIDKSRSKLAFIIFPIYSLPLQ